MNMATGGKRAYRSQLRDEQAAATRARILDAAADLFGANGYAGTTMGAIAASAGVSVETVQGNGPKASLLLAAIERAAAGEEGQQGIIDRPIGREIAQEADPDRLAARFADMLAWSHRRTWALWRQFGAASASDETVRAAYDGLLGRMQADWRRTVADLDARGLVAPGLDREQLAITLWLLALPDTYQRLVIEAGWTTAAFKRWIVQRFQRELAG
jgi:AcrR family transcriptional regulator